MSLDQNRNAFYLKKKKMTCKTFHTSHLSHWSLVSVVFARFSYYLFLPTLIYNVEKSIFQQFELINLWPKLHPWIDWKHLYEWIIYFSMVNSSVIFLPLSTLKYHMQLALLNVSKFHFHFHWRMENYFSYCLWSLAVWFELK